MRQRFASSRRVCRAHGWPRRRHVGTGFPISFCFRGARRIARGGLARPLGLCRLSFDQKRTELTPGTVLVRDWDRQSQRVMGMSEGFAWNGQTYDSLSKVAFAITGTKWNGPRFFGLRDNEDRSATEARS